MLNNTTLMFALVSAMTTAAFANGYKVGNLEIDNPVARATAPGAKVGGGYVVITNTGDQPDRLIGGAANFAGKIEIHEMKMQNDVMRMRPIEGGLVIPAGETVTLVPGGNHIMFMKMDRALTEGEERKAKLTFEKAGSVEVTFKVISIAESLKLKGAAKMDHKKMKHSN